MQPLKNLYKLKNILKRYKDLGRPGFNTEDYPLDSCFVTESYEFAVCNRWLSTKQKIKTINNKISSYGLKQKVEKRYGEYVSNGVFIAAALYNGFKIKKSGPNAFFNISHKNMNRWVKREIQV